MADRLLVGTAVISVIIHGAVPLWFGLTTIAREVLVAGVTPVVVESVATRV